MGEFYIGLCFHGSISFMINVHIRGSIQATRGLHQGCPLPPYLFLNCAKAFSCMLYAAELTRLIWRVRFSSDIWVSHLLFPDTLRGLRYAGGDFFSSFNGFRSNLVTRNLIFHSVHMWHLPFGWRLRIYLGLLRSLLLIGSWIYLQWSGGSGGLFPMNSNFRWIKIIELANGKNGCPLVGVKRFWLKLLALPISTYMMSVFRLLTNICDGF